MHHLKSLMTFEEVVFLCEKSQTNTPIICIFIDIKESKSFEWKFMVPSVMSKNFV